MITVSYEGFDVATIESDDAGWRLRYDPRWLETRAAFPLSLALPLSQELHGPDAFEPWILARAPAKSARKGLEPALAGLCALGEADLGAMRFSLGFSEPRMGAPRGEIGAPVRLTAKAAPTAPQRGETSTHVLKPEAPSRPGDLENRLFCNALARRVGLDAAAITPGRGPGGRYILETRGDRLIRPDGSVIGLHAECFAHARISPPRGDGVRAQSRRDGVDLADLFALADAHLNADERLRLLDAVIFTTLIGDPDADAKRYRILLSGPLRLAPLVDLAAAGPWRGRERRLAPRFAGKAVRPEQVSLSVWREMAHACRLNPTFAGRRVAEIGAAILSEADAAMQTVCSGPEAAVVQPSIVAYFRRAVLETTAHVLHRLRADAQLAEGPAKAAAAILAVTEDEGEKPATDKSPTRRSSGGAAQPTAASKPLRRDQHDVAGVRDAKDRAKALV